jgi:hypothetical protein
MCGVACLRMALDHWKHPVPPALPLVRELSAAGAYLRDGNTVKGLIYQPFADHVTSRYKLSAQACPDLPAHQLPDIINNGALVLVSVHKTIRTPDLDPPGQGGHLVLAVGTSPEHVMLHNPSGLPGQSQQFATLTWNRFDHFYAKRGVILHV